jgi:hypothetical protein
MAQGNLAQITKAGWGFQSIVRAIERCILIMEPTLSRDYAWNFRGITEALWDLGNLLEGHLSSSAVGPWPPGSIENPPGSGNVTIVSPRDGSFWFDTRQGRLFVAIGGAWYQTNGAESFVHVGATPRRNPETGGWSERHGLLWLNTIDGRLYLYVDDPVAEGEPGWYEMAGGSTGTLPPEGGAP